MSTVIVSMRLADTRCRSRYRSPVIALVVPTAVCNPRPKRVSLTLYRACDASGTMVYFSPPPLAAGAAPAGTAGEAATAPAVAGVADGTGEPAVVPYP